MQFNGSEITVLWNCIGFILAHKHFRLILTICIWMLHGIYIYLLAQYYVFCVKSENDMAYVKISVTPVIICLKKLSI